MCLISKLVIGRGTALVTNNTLVNEVSRFAITGSPNFTTTRKVSFQGDLNSVQASGLTLQEFGLFASGLANTGSLFLREAIGSLTFDGTNELRLEATIEFIPS